jgi:citrate synthase
MGSADALTRLQADLPALSVADTSAYDLTPAALERTGCRIIRHFAELVAGSRWSDAGLVATLQQGWQRPGEDVAELLNAALVLSADHELNISTFTLRCVASAGAPLYAAVASGLAAMQGGRHGGATLRIEALLAEVGESADAGAVLHCRLRRGDALPGLGHTLYPQGDPRGALLLTLLQRQRPNHRAVARAVALAEAAAELPGKQPTHDYALAALCQALDLPPGTALQLFALGRCTGWIAHAIEEYGRGRLIRPRARYTGPTPLPAQL